MPRLPLVGSDRGSWGSILNEYLSQSLENDGSLKASTVGPAQLKAGSVSTTALADGSVTAIKIAPNSFATLDGGGRVPDSQLPMRLSDAELSAKFVSAIRPNGTSGAAIQAALDSAHALGNATVLLPRGTYTISSTLIVDGVHFIGEAGTHITGSPIAIVELRGTNAVIEGIEITSTFSGGCIGVNIGTNAKNASVRYCRIYGNSLMQAININTTGISGVSVESNEIDGVCYGFLSDQLAIDLTDVRIINNRFVNIIGDAIELNNPIKMMGYNRTPYVDAAKHFVISGNYISVPNGSGTTAGFGIGIAGTSHVAITGNTFNDVRNEGVHIEDYAQHITITGNTFNNIGGETANDSAINALPFSSHVVVQGNTIKNVTGDGVVLMAVAEGHSSEYTVANNIITGCTLKGIRVLGVETNQQNTHIHGNTITQSGDDGIYVTGANATGQILISDNISTANTGYGLTVERREGIVIGTNILKGNTLGQFRRQGNAPITLRSLQGSATANVPAEDFSTPVALFPLGLRAEGIVTVTVVDTATTDSGSSRIWNLSWDGSTLNAVSGSLNSWGVLDAVEVSASGGMLQTRVYGAAARNVRFDGDFSGIVLI